MQSALLYTAQHLVNVCGPYGAVTPMKLQKLLFYVKAWGLMEEQDLVDGEFEKWKYGPVNPDVYRAFKEHGAQPLQPREVPLQFMPTGRQRELTDFIALSYAPFSALALSAMTHREPPWWDTAEGARITREAMQAFYNATHPFGSNFPFDPAQPYVAVPSNAKAAFTLDMTEEEARLVTTFPDFPAYKQYLERLSYAQPFTDLSVFDFS